MLYRVLRSILRVLFRVVYRPTVTGREHIPATGSVILASNHRSFVDSVVIPLAAPRQIAFLTKHEYFTGTGLKGALVRWFFTTIGQVPVRRGDHRASQAALQTALEVLRRGEAFGVYPEGTRSRDGRLWRGRTGVGWLALEARCPVVPVALRGTEDMQPIDSRMLRPARVRVQFGEPIDPAAYDGLKPAQARRKLTDDVMDAIAAMSGQERADAYHPMSEAEEAAG
jgi:1-acyl-sn-glycerol-3-phosphate acyltransferase